MLTPTQISAAEACSATRRLLFEGDHAGAVATLAPYWDGLYSHPKIKGLPPAEQVEVLILCGRVTAAKARAQQIAGLFDEAETLLKNAVRRAESADLPLWEAQSELAHCYWRRGKFEEARKVLRVARAITGTDSTDEYVLLTTVLCIVEYSDGNPQSACEIAEDIADLVEGVADPLIRARYYDAHANALNLLGKFDEALIKYAGAGAYFERAGHRRHAIAVENNIANVLIKAGRPQDAHEHLNRVFNFYRSISDRSALGQTLETIAQAYIAENDLEAAHKAINKSISYLEGDETGILEESRRTKEYILLMLEERAKINSEIIEQDYDNVRFISCKQQRSKEAPQPSEMREALQEGNLLRVSPNFFSCRGLKAGDVLVFKRLLTPREGEVVVASCKEKYYIGTFALAGKGFNLLPCCSEYEGWDFSDGSAQVKGVVIGFIKQGFKLIESLV